jgi:hypothetical protein
MKAPKGVEQALKECRKRWTTCLWSLNHLPVQGRCYSSSGPNKCFPAGALVRYCSLHATLVNITIEEYTWTLLCDDDPRLWSHVMEMENI